jgi:hypothetical protein
VGSGNRRGKREALRTIVEARGLVRITEADFEELLRALAPVSEVTLRRLLRETGLPLAPLVCGIRQDSFENLERTLLDMGREYAGADPARARLCRRAAITAKEHARFALRRPKLTADERAAKEEMVLWLLTWLENPGVFATWLELRKKVAR